MVDDRGQAYTLEGFVGALVVLTALLFVFQSIVLTPTTAGTVDQDVKAQLRVQANDALRTADTDGALRNLTRYWNASGGFAYTNGTDVGYGTHPPCAPTVSPDGTCDSFGETLRDVFTARGYTYNLYVTYQLASDPTETATERVVYRGVPSANAVTATRDVVLYDDQWLTAPEDAGNATLEALGSGGFYAPDASDGVVYNVVEVRLVVW
ncbi:hypothetical protein [Haladaptatus sp. T7]|uniref:DUF7288 family protein n=1 Tax=Haladaptatus sp. T7 TaxID=2029368 RepID=UPI0021A25B21|nr:hypothetical protein [Haladaptatus sp. T7]GKZ12265.1 hypothetical protein HAL_01460 [Haladaptatus sp. T7]